MKIPRKIKVGQFTYIVKYTPDELRNSTGDRLFAESRHFEREIIFDSKANQISKEETFIHEIVHCLDSVYKISDKSLSENTVERMGTALHKFIQDNPGVFK